MELEPDRGVVDALKLRFVGENSDGSPLHELRASHVAEVLEGLVGLTSDFSKAGVFGDGPGSEVLVRPAQEGSFIIEVVRFVADGIDGVNGVSTAVGGPPVGLLIWWATRAARADVKDFAYLENGNVKVTWQDDTVHELPRAAWEELNKRKKRRKKHLRQIMAPLSDARVEGLEVADQSMSEDVPPEAELFSLDRADYEAMRPEDEVGEDHEIFDVEAQMSAINFDDPQKWKVKTLEGTRDATVQDDEFLGRVSAGLAIRKSDIFRLQIREDRVTKNGRTRTKWTVLRVENHRRAAHDDDA